VARLRAAGCVAAEEEAEELSAAAADAAALESLVHRREQGEPLAWITGAVLFCGRPVAVDRGVYVPRGQSEELARRAGRVLARSARRRAVDLCTGAGAVAVHLLATVPGARVVGVDLDMAAARCARRNGVPTVRADLAAPFRAATFDVVTAVAPYVPTPEIRLLPADVRDHEPRRALDGGPDGLAVVREVVDAATRLLGPAGSLLLEIGGRQDDVLIPELAAAGYTAVTTWRDEDGDLRGVCASAQGRSQSA
jgi:release factor glutamine methyltransferase